MDGPQNNQSGSRSRHLRYDDDVVEEVFKLGRSGDPEKDDANSGCIIREDIAPDSDVTVGESEKLPLRIR